MPPESPSINPHQMLLLRIVAAMAWSDGDLAEEEVDVMLDNFSKLFGGDEQDRSNFRQELSDYITQNIPLEELIPKLKTNEERELVLKLSYEVITSSARTPEEPLVNDEEKLAYQKMVQLLGLDPEVVDRIESEVRDHPTHRQNLVNSLLRQLEEFFR